jgi:predicted ATP-grasp superfamily ATP-dependent carboligase
VRAFTRTDDYLRSILNTSKIPTDELVIAVLRHAVRAHGHAPSYLVQMGKELSRLLSDDYDRLSSIIRRVVN